LSLYFQDSNSGGKLCQGLEVYIWFGLFELIKKWGARGLDKNFPQIASTRAGDGLKPGFVRALTGTAKAVPSRLAVVNTH